MARYGKSWAERRAMMRMMRRSGIFRGDEPERPSYVYTHFGQHGIVSLVEVRGQPSWPVYKLCDCRGGE